MTHPFVIRWTTLLVALTLLSLIASGVAASPTTSKPPDEIETSLLSPRRAAATVKRAANTQLQPRAPQSSRGMGRRRVKQSIAERAKAKKDYSAFLCPGGSFACPAQAYKKEKSRSGRETEKPLSPEEMEKSLNSLADWFKMGFECVEYENEMNSCGGCVTLGHGRDCTLIPFARRVGCEQSECIVYQCKDGYTVSPDKSECVKRSNSGASAIDAYGLDDADSNQIPWS